MKTIQVKLVWVCLAAVAIACEAAHAWEGQLMLHAGARLVEDASGSVPQDGGSLLLDLAPGLPQGRGVVRFGTKNQKPITSSAA